MTVTEAEPMATARLQPDLSAWPIIITNADCGGKGGLWEGR